jgi:hypothetical protein
VKFATQTPEYGACKGCYDRSHSALTLNPIISLCQTDERSSLEEGNLIFGAKLPDLSATVKNFLFTGQCSLNNAFTLS